MHISHTEYSIIIICLVSKTVIFSSGLIYIFDFGSYLLRGHGIGWQANRRQGGVGSRLSRIFCKSLLLLRPSSMMKWGLHALYFLKWVFHWYSFFLKLWYYPQDKANKLKAKMARIRNLQTQITKDREEINQLEHKGEILGKKVRKFSLLFPVTLKSLC